MCELQGSLLLVLAAVTAIANIELTIMVSTSSHLCCTYAFPVWHASIERVKKSSCQKQNKKSLEQMLT